VNDTIARRITFRATPIFRDLQSDEFPFGFQAGMWTIMLLVKNIGRTLAIAFALAGVVLFFSSSSPSLAQTAQSASQPQEPEPGVDDDPTRAVFFSVREEYRNLLNGTWNNRIVLRKDAVVLKGRRVGGRAGFILRTDVPITTTQLGSETHMGLGDIYGQALYIPHLGRKFALVTGTAIVLPTATHKTLGQGKWQIAPLAVPVWYLARKKGFFLVKFQDFISIAGASDRPNVHALFINPTLNYLPARRWLVQAEVESRTNWKNDSRTDFRVGFGTGRVMTRRFFLGLKCEVPMGGTRSGDWTIKVINTFYRH
jgi:hypothetical protein